KEVTEARQPGSRHPLAHAYEERWLESNLIGAIRQLLPSIDVRHIYPQVPSFVGEERNIIDLLTVSTEGRLVVIEIKASADPDRKEVTEARQPGSRHPLAHAYEERWLESNLIGAIRQLLPSIDVRHIYPQVPSFVGEERNIIDLLTVSTEGRLVVIEIKASAD